MTKKKSANGLQFNAPPVGPIMEAVSKMAIDAADKLPVGASGGIFAIATTKGVNAVVVHRFNETFSVQGWIGKEWGAPLAGGASARIVWSAVLVVVWLAGQ